MTHLLNLVQFLNQTLPWEGLDDSSQNGLQVESSQDKIHKIALAVDSGLSVIEKAVSKNCQLLIVHHGLFWGGVPNLAGIMGKKVRTLIEGGCSLYASHLPLDAHPEVGNNAQIIKKLGASLGNEFCRSGARSIGFVAEFDTARSIEEFELSLMQLTSKDRFLSLKFGKREIKRFGVVSGGAAFAVHEAASLGLDAFITGEPKQNIFHETKELEINAFFAGHYATETFGVNAVGELLQNKFGIAFEFIDEPTRI